MFWFCGTKSLFLIHLFVVQWTGWCSWVQYSSLILFLLDLLGAPKLCMRLFLFGYTQLSFLLFMFFFEIVVCSCWQIRHFIFFTEIYVIPFPFFFFSEVGGFVGIIFLERFCFLFLALTTVIISKGGQLYLPVGVFLAWFLNFLFPTPVPFSFFLFLCFYSWILFFLLEYEVLGKFYSFLFVVLLQWSLSCQFDCCFKGYLDLLCWVIFSWTSTSTIGYSRP